MSKTKIVRCIEPGCRTLTAADRCDQHREPVAAAAPIHNAATPARLADLQRGLALAVEWERGVDAIDALRDTLAGLRHGAAQIDRRGARPTFAEDRP